MEICVFFHTSCTQRECCMNMSARRFFDKYDVLNEKQATCRHLVEVISIYVRSAFRPKSTGWIVRVSKKLALPCAKH